ADVAPVFGAVTVAEGMELIEEMVVTFVKERAVRIVNPLGGSSDVKDGASRVGLSAWYRGLDRSRGTREGFLGGFAAGAQWQGQHEEGATEDGRWKTERGTGPRTNVVRAVHARYPAWSRLSLQLGMESWLWP